MEKRLRSVDVFNDQPDKEIGNYIGRQPAPGKPPRNFGQWYASVYWGGGTGNDRNPQRYDVFNGVGVTLTARLNYAPKDRQAIRFGSVGDVYDLVDRIIAPDVIHGNWATINYANEFIVGTQAYVDIHGGDATVNGYIETLITERFGPEREAQGEWIGAESTKDVYIVDIRFGLARRIQANYEPRT